MESQHNTELPIGSLRIGLFTDTYAPQVNGVSVSLQMISEGLKKRGHQVTIFAPRFPGYKDDEPNVMRLPSLKYLNNPPIYVAVLGTTPRSTWKLTREHFDVLHAHSPASVGLAGISHSIHQTPAIDLHLSHLHHRLHPLHQIHRRHAGSSNVLRVGLARHPLIWRPDRCAFAEIPAPAVGIKK
jgi:glycosyltransferase involved in cell wall biosynthesis